MRILYVQQHFATGRGEGGVRGVNLMRTLIDHGHDVTVICGQNWRDSTLVSQSKSAVTETEVDGIRIVQLNVFYSNHQGFLRRVFSFLRFAWLACWQVLRRPCDLIYASSTPLTVSIPALCARWIKGTPYVFEVRDLWPDLPIEMGIVRNPILKRLLYFWEWLTYRWAWKLVALAPGIQDGIARKAKIPRERIAMVPNGSDTRHLQPLARTTRRLLPVSDELFVLGFAGTHGRANGLDAVLDAAAELKRRNVRHICFALVGDGREKPRLMERAKAEGLDNVHFLGLFNKTLYGEVLNEFDVGMQILENVPGFHYGTSPNKFFDYLAVGKPVLVNYPGWMSSLVRDHRCGVAVPPDDPKAFADAAMELALNREQLPEMGRRARELAETQFSQQKILVDIAKFIEDREEPGQANSQTHASQSVGEVVH